MIGLHDGERRRERRREREEEGGREREEEGGREGERERARITKHTHSQVHVQVLICTYMYYSCANLLRSSDVDKHLVDGGAIYTWIHKRVTKQQSLGNHNKHTKAAIQGYMY